MTQSLHQALEKLNAQQKKAVETTEGRVLVLAGAGSGKTSVLTYRIAYLLLEKKVDPEQILGLTFTNKAAKEMRERLCAIVGKGVAKKVFLSTFHSFCMWILRKEIETLGYTKDFSLYTEKEVKRLVNQLTRHMLEHEGDLPSLENTFSKLQAAKTKGLSPDDEQNPWHDDFIKDLFQKLTISMRAYNAVDFDSLLSLTIKLFDEHPEKMEKYRMQYRYVLIDEYQDTNPTQFLLAEHLSKQHNNLFVVGDDDQSIYGWRGADVKNILQFTADVTIKLEQNYRSSPCILNAANSVIANNKERHSKTLWSSVGDSLPITVFHAPTEAEEAQSVAERIVKLKQRYNLAWKDFAILYRSNLLARPFEIALMNALWQSDKGWIRGIPYEVFGSTELYERSEVKDLYAYIQVLLNSHDQESLLRIINVPRRGISENALDLLTSYNRKHNIALWEVLEKICAKEKSVSPLIQELSAKALGGIESFVLLINETKEKLGTQRPLYQALSNFLERLDYKKAIKEDVKSEKMRDFKWENIELCLQALKRYEEEHQDRADLHDFVTSSLLNLEHEGYLEKSEKEDKVHLMTFHSAKGLEFPACFLVGIEDHIIPHEKSLQETGVEEERRLFYVALTRSKRFLTLSMARARKRLGKEMNSTPSRFLFEIPNELLNIVSWQTID